VISIAGLPICWVCNLSYLLAIITFPIHEGVKEET